MGQNKKGKWISVEDTIEWYCLICWKRGELALIQSDDHESTRLNVQTLHMMNDRNCPNSNVRIVVHEK